MKAIVGVDTAGTYEPAVRLLARLRFRQIEATVLNVADLVLPYTSLGGQPTFDMTSQYVEALQAAGKEAVREAKELAAQCGLTAETAVLSGPSVLTLLDEADRTLTDVIAVASTRKGPLASVFIGSMSRSIVSGSKHSVLVAKEGIANSGPLNVVLATDHSNYANQAIDRFLALAPQGIARIHVATAYTVSDDEAKAHHVNLPIRPEEGIEKWIEDRVTEKSRELVGKLSQHGYEADFKVHKGDANHVIADAMKETGSELLVVGAQGHGFLDRLFVGSVSFHQLVVEPYSVFIVRAE